MFGYQKIKLSSLVWILLFAIFVLYGMSIGYSGAWGVGAFVTIWLIINAPLWICKKAIGLVKR